MKVSIVTVCYNNVDTIGDTLSSVARQTHVDIDHVVIDGGSTDGTIDVLRQHSGHSVRLLSEPDRGIYDAMNKGVRLATGELVGFLNADDLLSGPGVIATIAARAAATAADCVYGDLVYVNRHDCSRVLRQWRSGEYWQGRLRRGWMPPHPTFYVRREQLQRLGGFDEGFRIAADYDFMLRFLTRAGVRVAYVPEVLVHMRTGGASNRSVAAMLHKSREDLRALRRSGVGGVATLLCKNLRKLPQFGRWRLQ